MQRPETSFLRWTLWGPKIEKKLQEYRKLVYPDPIKVPGKGVVYPDPDYGDGDRHRIAYRILELGIRSGPVGFDMDQVAKELIDATDPTELAVANELLSEFNALFTSQDLA